MEGTQTDLGFGYTSKTLTWPNTVHPAPCPVSASSGARLRKPTTASSPH